MKKTAFAGVIIGVLAIFTGSVMTGCNSYIGAAGPTGIDTIGALKRGLIDMTITDSTLIPALVSPVNAVTGVIPNNPTLMWNSVRSVAKYRVVVSTDSDFDRIVIDDSSLASASDTARQVYALSGTSTYYWCVAGMKAGKMGWSRINHFVTEFDSSVIKEQNAYVAQQFGMFIHFNMSTFARWPYPLPGGDNSEWENGGEDPNLCHPWQLNCGQWADVAKSAGCRYAVLTTKHHGGFCLWPTKVAPSATNHNVALSSWYQNDGQRDILREFVDSVRSRGLKAGFYYSIWDRTNPVTLSMVLGELREILTNYGDIDCIWFDGWGWANLYPTIPYDSVANLVHRLNDSLGHHTIISDNNRHLTLYNSELVQYEIPVIGPPQAGNNIPAEGNEPIRADQCWFWHTMDTTLQTTSFVNTRIQNCNSADATYLLDVTPDTNGLIPGYQVQQMQLIGTTVSPLLTPNPDTGLGKVLK